MVKPPSFASDVGRVNESVNSDVSTILRLAADQQVKTVGDKGTPVASKSGLERKLKPAARRLASVPTPAVLVNITTRISAALNDKLTEAALRQRLKKRQPDSRQGIIQGALQDWLKKHGYARENVSQAEADEEYLPSEEAEVAEEDQPGESSA